LFDRKDDIGPPLAMVSVLLLVAVLLPLSLALVWKRHLLPHQRHPHRVSFHDRSVGDFAVWGERGDEKALAARKGQRVSGECLFRSPGVSTSSPPCK
jgi:hypothetical protein